MPSIAWNCDQCKKYTLIVVTAGQDILCPHCQKRWAQISDLSTVFDQCPICQCRQFYLQKDFNQGAGCLVMLIGILLVPKTYGLSLPFFALLDWLFYRKVPAMVVCYRCGAEFKGFEIPSHLKPFLHHIGMKYDKYR